LRRYLRGPSGASPGGATSGGVPFLCSFLCQPLTPPPVTPICSTLRRPCQYGCRSVTYTDIGPCGKSLPRRPRRRIRPSLSPPRRRLLFRGLPLPLRQQLLEVLACPDRDEVHLRFHVPVAGPEPLFDGLPEQPHGSVGVLPGELVLFGRPQLLIPAG